MGQIDYAPVQQAMEKLKALSADEEVRRLADARELALFMEQAEMRAVEARGIAMGMENAVKRLMLLGNTEAQARTMLGL